MVKNDSTYLEKGGFMMYTFNKSTNVELHLLEKGKPSERMGRKASGPDVSVGVAGLPKVRKFN